MQDYRIRKTGFNNLLPVWWI